jgi:hypothetical protein
MNKNIYRGAWAVGVMAMVGLMTACPPVTPHQWRVQLFRSLQPAGPVNITVTSVDCESVTWHGDDGVQHRTGTPDAAAAVAQSIIHSQSAGVPDKGPLCNMLTDLTVQCPDLKANNADIGTALGYCP